MAELKSDARQNAIADFEKASKVNKKFADAFNNIGAVYFVEKNFGQAAKYFKKAVALDETRATFHVNLGAAWFSPKKLDRAVNEYARALQLDPDALVQNARAGINAQVLNPEERAAYEYMLAKIQAKRGNLQECLVCLKKAKDDGYCNLANVYKDEEFSQLWKDPRLAKIAPPQQRSSGIKRTDWCRLQKRRTRSGTAMKAAQRLRVRSFSSMRFISHPAWRMH